MSQVKDKVLGEWNAVLKSLEGKKVHLSLNLESVQEAVGVNTNCLVGGFQAYDVC